MRHLTKGLSEGVCENFFNGVNLLRARTGHEHVARRAFLRNQFRSLHNRIEMRCRVWHLLRILQTLAEGGPFMYSRHLRKLRSHESHD